MVKDAGNKVMLRSTALYLYRCDVVEIVLTLCFCTLHVGVNIAFVVRCQALG